MILTDQVKDRAIRSVLCWLATVDPDGCPNVSPKEIFAITDDSTLVIANIASPASVRNVVANDLVCVSFVDVLVQKGFKIFGRAKYVSKSEAVFGSVAKVLIAKAGPKFPIHGVFVIQASRVEQIVAPSYRLYPDETTEDSQVRSAMRTYGLGGEV